MARVVVEVVDASDLTPNHGQGSATPFVEVDLDDQKQRTQTKPKDVNPYWNEKLAFNINDLRDLPNKTIDVTVFNDLKGSHDRGHHKNFLGRVRISGVSVPFSESEANVQRYPLDKRGLFSRVNGDIALKIYAHPLHDASHFTTPPTNATTTASSLETEETPLQEINTNKFGDHDVKLMFDHEKIKKKKKEKEVRTFHSIGTAAGGPGPAPAAPPPVSSTFGFETHQKPPVVETRMDFAKAAAPTPSVMQMQMPKTNPEFLLVETSPPVAARLRYRGRDKTASTYDLVELMHYLYVDVVKARNLPVMDVSGSLDPYVEVKLGNYKGITKHLEKNQNPVWHQIFAFSKERLQSNLVEVTVKDKDIGKDDFVGRVTFDLFEVPHRVPPDSPLAPQWYRLEDRKGDKITKGEIMLAVWIGTQADESFAEAWHSDAHNISQKNLANTRSKVYISPKLYYLRVFVFEAQDLVPSDKGRAPDACVRIQLGNQLRVTRPSPVRTVNPVWNEEHMLVASEPFEDLIIVTVEDRIGPGKDEILGREFIPVRNVPQRHETTKLPDPRWFNLHKPSLAEAEGAEKKEKFSSKILIRFCLEAGYHVLDESTHFSSDLQPSSKSLRKGSIGTLELGILSAKNLMPMKNEDGKLTDAYCVAKYGNKWIRTRTILDTLDPRWNEQYTWDVYDPCTVITIGVFDNCRINGSKAVAKDQRIGKVRIRLSTLETDRIYTHYYPLVVLTPSGLKKNGELHLVLRFTCTAWVNMVTIYGRPLLPKMHYVQPISVRLIDWLRHQAMQIVAARLGRAEPPLRREIVEYMLDADYNMWSLRKSKANYLRIMELLSGVTAIFGWFNDICTWRNPVATVLIHALFLILVCYPQLILPTIFLCLFVIGMWNYRFRPRHPPHPDAELSQAINADPFELDEEFDSSDELDEEFDTFPTSRPSDTIGMRYGRLRSVGGRVQTVVGDLASQSERAQAMLYWRDPRATSTFIIFSLIWAVFIYVTPFQVVAVLIGLYMLRHPWFRSKMPSVPVNFFKRLPSKSDMLI